MESLSQKKKVKSFKERLIVCCLILALTLPLTVMNALGLNVPSIKQIAYYLGVSEENSDYDSVEFWFISVGQGDCSVIKAGDTCFMIDCGTPDSYDEINYFLNVKGISNIDYLIVSHPHSDHIGTAFGLLDKFRIKELYMPDIKPEDSRDAEYYDKMMFTAGMKGVKTTMVKDGFSFTFDRLKFDFYCGEGDDFSGENENSLVTLVSANGKRVLYTADIGFVYESYLMQNNRDIDTDILKVAHHGSKYSTSKRFVEYTSPEYSVISVGKNTYGHPTNTAMQTLLDAGSKIYRTDISTVGFGIGRRGDVSVLSVREG